MVFFYRNSMQTCMVFFYHNLQIFYSIIFFVSINVVDMLICGQFSSKTLFHYCSMSSVISNMKIWGSKRTGFSSMMTKNKSLGLSFYRFIFATVCLGNWIRLTASTVTKFHKDIISNLSLNVKGDLCPQ